MSEKGTSLKKREEQSPADTERTRERRTYVPATDIHEREDALVLLVDMPGVDEKNVDIELEGGTLTISGRAEPDTVEGFRRALAEYELGDYQRNFQLSDEVNRDGIEASVRDGVLTLVLPKSEKTKPRQIEVKRG